MFLGVQLNHMNRMYTCKEWSIPDFAVEEAIGKYQVYYMQYELGQALYWFGLVEELKEKYKCRDSSGSRALD